MKKSESVCKEIFVRSTCSVKPTVLLLIFSLLLVFPFSFIYQSKAAPTQDNFMSSVFSQVEQLMKDEGIKGLTMAFVMKDIEPVVKAFGYADLEKNIPATPTTVFPMASLTKSITNIGILQLADQGLLKLSDPVKMHLPEFSIQSRYEASRDITINDLLSHYGGIPRGLYKGLIASSGDYRPELLEYLRGQYVTFAPGTKHAYSNLGYELLGLIIEEVTNMPYQQYIIERVLGPMGMTNSYFLTDDVPNNSPSLAYLPYSFEQQNEFPMFSPGSSGLYSCAEDFSIMLKWLLVNDGFNPVTDKSLKESMYTDQKPNDALDVSFQSGWSWVVEDYPEPFQGQLAYMLGSTTHYNSLIAMSPEYKTGIVFMSNTAGVLQSVMELARDIIAQAIQKETGQNFLSKPAPLVQHFITPDPELADFVRGNFLSENYFLQIFSIKEDVIMQVGTQVFKLFLNPDGWFLFNPAYRFKMEKVANRKVLFVENDGFISPVGFDVFREYDLRQDIALKLGRYNLYNVDPLSEELFYKQLELRMEGEILQATLYLGDSHQAIYGIESNTYNLIPTPEGNVIFAGFGMYKGETLFLSEDKNGHIVSFAGLEFFMPGEL